MMDHEPMLQDDDFCRALLSSSDGDEPPSSSRDRLASALGIPPLLMPAPPAAQPSPPVNSPELAPPAAPVPGGESVISASSAAAVTNVTTGAASTVAATAPAVAPIASIAGVAGAGTTTSVATTGSSAAALLLGKWTAVIAITTGLAVSGALVTRSGSSPVVTSPITTSASGSSFGIQGPAIATSQGNSPAPTGVEPVEPPSFPGASAPSVASTATGSIVHGEPASETGSAVAAAARPTGTESTPTLGTTSPNATGATSTTSATSPTSNGDHGVTADGQGAERSAGPAPAVATSSSTALTLEVLRIDHVREAIASGNGAAALRELDAYGREFPSGSLRGEATLLRVDALLLAGDRASAASLARALVNASPSAPFAPRLRKIAGMSNP